VWAFTFTGSGKTKYSNELLELTCNFEYEYSSKLQELVKNNWLCNLSDIDGCWFGLDLLQEKNIKQWKKMAQCRDADFGGPFFQQIVALNIQAFLQTTSSMRSAVKLAKTRASHRRTGKPAALNELMWNMEQQQLHCFRKGQSRGSAASDDFEAGYLALADGKKIKEFITRTLRDAGAIHGDGEDASDDSSDDDTEDAPMPNMTIGGRLVASNEIDSDDEGEDEDWRMENNITSLFGEEDTATDSKLEYEPYLIDK